MTASWLKIIMAACGSIFRGVQKAPSGRRAHSGKYRRWKLKRRNSCGKQLQLARCYYVWQLSAWYGPSFCKKLHTGSYKTEASGGVTLESLPAFKGTGVNYISLGFLTIPSKFSVSMDVTLSNVNLWRMPLCQFLMWSNNRMIAKVIRTIEKGYGNARCPPLRKVRQQALLYTRPSLSKDEVLFADQTGDSCNWPK